MDTLAKISMKLQLTGKEICISIVSVIQVEDKSQFSSVWVRLRAITFPMVVMQATMVQGQCK